MAAGGPGWGWGWGGGGPGGPDGPAPQELQLRWQEYRQLVMLLLQWVRHHTAVFEERKFPSSFEEIEVGVLVLAGGGPGPRWEPGPGC